MSSQLWRDFLATDLSSLQAQSDTRLAMRLQKIYNILSPAKSAPEVKPRSTVGEAFFWQGNGYLPGVLPPENVVRQILWELYELNFSREFLSLDRRACQDLDLSDNDQLLERQSLILKCFVAGTFILPHANYGLASNTVQDRLPYLQLMVQVMVRWKGIKPSVFEVANCSPQTVTDARAKELEEAATKYYCQQFFSYFGRAAQVPHRLFCVGQ
jgi:hypothetical protein